MILSKILSPFMPYIIGGLVAAIIGLSINSWWVGKKYDDLKTESAAKLERAAANVSKLETNIEEQNASIDKFKEDVKKAKLRADKRSEDLASMRADLNETRNENESYKSRWDKAASKKPELVNRLLNRATAKRVQLFATATCRANCNKDGNKDGSDNAATETRPDSRD